MNKALEKALKTIKFDTRMIETTANKVIIRRRFISKPSNNYPLLTTICTNRITIRDAVNNRGKSRSKIKIVHNQKNIAMRT